MSTPTRTFLAFGANTQTTPLVIPTLAKIFDVMGFYSGAVDGVQFYYLQLFNFTTALQSGVSVPFRSLPVNSPNGFKYAWINGLDGYSTQPAGVAPAAGVIPGLGAGWQIALSSTKAVYTQTTQAIDIEVMLEEWELEYQGTTTVGDLTTTVASLAVWTAANWPATYSKLLRVDYTDKSQNTGTLGSYMVIFADINRKFFGVSGQYIRYVTQASSITAFYGNQDGFQPFATDTSGNQYHACYIGCMAALPVANTLNNILANGATIRAIIK